MTAAKRRDHDDDVPPRRGYVRRLPVSLLLEYLINPYKTPIWDGKTVLARSDIENCIKENRLESVPWDVLLMENRHTEDTENRKLTYNHAARVAYLVLNHDHRPICVSVLSILGDYADMVNGCHRLAAAAYRGDKTISVTYDGFTEGFRNWIYWTMDDWKKNAIQ